jgi:HEAT repeat protein
MRHSLLTALAACASAAPLAAQSLADRIANAPQPRVQFTYAARPDVCGNGRTFLSIANSSWHGSWNDGDRREACVAGPARVLIDRAGREVVSIATFAGPVPETPSGVTDLGRVSPRAAVDYLLSLADGSEGRVSRDAVLPAIIADSVDVSPRLLAIAKNQNGARQTRTSAISWLARPLDNRERNVKDIADAMLAIARDEDDNQGVRQQSLRTLARLEHGVGTAPLTELARNAERGWLAREALASLTSSGDPRARQHLRDVVRRAELPDDVLSAAIRGLGGDYATGEDMKIIRDAYPKFTGEKARESAISAIATFGGSENVRWLLAIARNPDQPIQTRRRAIHHAYRGGTSVSEIIKIYDESTDTQLKEAVLSTLVESGDKQATDKLMQIARMDENSQMRRKAINVLSRSSDERVKKFLQDLANR